MKVIDFFAMNKIGCPMKGKVKRSNSILVCVRLRIHRYVSPPYIQYTVWLEICLSAFFTSDLLRKCAICMRSIPASSDTVESEGAADEAVLNKVHLQVKQKQHASRKL